MENASKALLIAGGILFAILILTLVVYLGKNITSFSKAQDEANALEQIEAFNKEYEAYNKKLMYGTDVISVINKAEENNLKYDNNQYYTIEISVKNKDNEYIEKNAIITNYKTSIFKCSKISYSQNTGKVKTMEFQEV